MKITVHTLKITVPVMAIIFSILNGCGPGKDKYTRGVGVYPGDPAAYAGPEMVKDAVTFRNLARYRASWHSSAWDYNLTAQLVTDGITDTRTPLWINMLVNQTPVPKNEREWLLDQNRVTVISRDTASLWVELDMSDSEQVPEVSGVGIHSEMEYDKNRSGRWEITCQASHDRSAWITLGQESGVGLPGVEKPNPWARFFASLNNDQGNQRRRRANPFASFYDARGDTAAPQPSFRFNFRMPGPAREVNKTYTLQQPSAYRFYRFGLVSEAAQRWTVSDLLFYDQGKEISVVPSHAFTSAWMSAGNGTEWVMTDLGRSAAIDTVRLHWISKAVEGNVQVSEDRKTWYDIASLPGGTDPIDVIPFSPAVNGRYVRILMSRPIDGVHYILSEMEVMGAGGTLPEPGPAAAPVEGKFYLTGGNWKICRASEVTGTGAEISRPGYDDHNWLPATVPGTALVSYLNAGALPDPDYGDNQLMISESYFNSDFWYRNTVALPEDFASDRVFLHFNGINWKADVYVNGSYVGHIDGAFIRGGFDITSLVEKGKKMALAVRIHKNDHIGVVKEQTALSPDKNGGMLGADNPTFHATIGWDWIPTIRGRDIGIWDDVYLTDNGPVTLKDPFVTTDLNLPDTTAADIHIRVSLVNHTAEEVSGTLTGRYGEISFERDVTLAPDAVQTVSFDPGTDPGLHLDHPRLWWPNGYGPQPLYDVSLAFNTEEGISDKTTFKSGIREMSYSESNQVLKIFINGRRLIGRGGNWGFSESNLRYRAREYDIAVAYHADMHFTMIRNWVGQTGDDSFYEACDRHGIMVWQDFWLANPADGPDPDDPVMFMENANDMVSRIRNHPSVAIYVGRNEGNPPEVLDTALRAMVKKVHPGILYISNSAMGVVSGGGPYRALPVRDYFLLYGFNKLHSERGMPNVMTFASLEQTLPEKALWPQNSMWGLHDYCLEGAQGAASFNDMIEKAFGPSENARQFTERAQWINYNGYRGMFEGRSPLRKGLLLWMSHPAWPSMVWQTYDYYFEPTAAYFGCKKASEPVHIQWNPVWDSVEVVNYNAGDQSGLLAHAALINMDGTLVWEKSKNLDCREDTTLALFKMDFTGQLTPVHFIRLTLSSGDQVLSENFYWRGTEAGNWQALNDLPAVSVDKQTAWDKKDGTWHLSTTLVNNTSTPALMIHLKVVGQKSGDRILPVFYSDNYVSLMPGEEKTITMVLKEEDTRGEKPVVDISGFNVKLGS